MGITWYTVLVRHDKESEWQEVATCKTKAKAVLLKDLHPAKKSNKKVREDIL